MMIIAHKHISRDRDFQQCGILTSVDSDQMCSLLIRLETPNNIQSVVKHS